MKKRKTYLFIYNLNRIYLMANRLGRYKPLYDSVVRADTASTIPRHVFVRAANIQGSKDDRKGDR